MSPEDFEQIWAKQYGAGPLAAAQIPPEWFSGLRKVGFEDLTQEKAFGKTVRNFDGSSSIFFNTGKAGIQDSTRFHELTHANQLRLLGLREFKELLQGIVNKSNIPVVERHAEIMADELRSGDFYKNSGGESGTTEYFIQSLRDMYEGRR